ncbi:hypothetical protein CSKR_110913 [Clonorchis sinensis]|uniref:Uncharacterized protein n=1 Tax=Clonorchis sinensis TaxID=79923 RepID=A0A3R7CDB2_CLOSI|nr:hypothetical protein CSKR_110913 [Clonorchis sinensis]
MSVQTRNLISEDLTTRSDMLIMRSDVLNWSFDSVELTSTSTLPEGFSDFPTLSNEVFGPMKSYGKASFTETEPCIDRNLIAQFFQCCRPEQRSYRHSVVERTGRHASLVKLERPSRFTTNTVTYSSLVGASGQYVNQVYRLIIQAPSLCKITKHAISSSSCTSSEIGLQTTPNYIWLPQTGSRLSKMFITSSKSMLHILKVLQRSRCPRYFINACIINQRTGNQFHPRVFRLHQRMQRLSAGLRQVVRQKYHGDASTRAFTMVHANTCGSIEVKQSVCSKLCIFIYLFIFVKTGSNEFFS